MASCVPLRSKRRYVYVCMYGCVYVCMCVCAHVSACALAVSILAVSILAVIVCGCVSPLLLFSSFHFPLPSSLSLSLSLSHPASCLSFHRASITSPSSHCSLSLFLLFSSLFSLYLSSPLFSSLLFSLSLSLSLSLGRPHKNRTPSGRERSCLAPQSCC
jgi:hypothetical protein